MEIFLILGALVVGYFIFRSSTPDNKKLSGSERVSGGAPSLKSDGKYESIRKAPKIFYSNAYSFRHPLSGDDNYFNHFIERYRSRFLLLTEDEDYSDWVIDSHMNDPVVTSGNGSIRSSIIHKLDNFLSMKIADNIIDSYMPVLVRKYKQLTYKDDYGVVIKEKWESEIKAFTRRVLLPGLSGEINTDSLCNFSSDFLTSNEPDTLSFWIDHITASVESEVNSDADEGLAQHDVKNITQYDVEEMNGIEYEGYVADIIESLGWEVTPTPTIGDHGADVIADNGQNRIVIQCKKYSSPVGNKSVQEAFSAKSFYDCSHSIVVTNSSFTSAARQAASKLNVFLLHHEQLQDFLESELC